MNKGCALIKDDPHIIASSSHETTEFYLSTLMAIHGAIQEISHVQ